MRRILAALLLILAGSAGQPADKAVTLQFAPHTILPTTAQMAVTVAEAASTTAPSYTETFYLCATGDGSLPETATCATAWDAADFNTAGNWDTDDANDGKIGPNDRVIVLDDGGVYRAALVPQQSGLSGKAITVIAESGTTPVLSGADLVASWSLDSTTVTPSVAAANDDYFVDVPGGYWTSNGFGTNVIEFGQGADSSAQFNMGLRFQLNVPKDATITTATISLVPTETQGSYSPAARISAHAADNSTQETQRSDWDTQHASLTTANVDWSFTGWTINVAKVTPSLNGIVQEIVNRAGWAANNYIQFFLDDNNGQNFIHFKVACYETPSGTEPQLTVTYANTGTYYASVTWEPNMVLSDEVQLTRAATKGAMTAGSYFYDDPADRLYVQLSDSSDPTGHVIEASHYPVVTAGPVNGNLGLIDFSSKSYIVVDGLELKYSNYYGVRFDVADNITVRNATFTEAYHNCVTANEAGGTNSSNITVIGNTFEKCGLTRTRSGGFEGVAINVNGIQTGTFSHNVIDNGFAENIQVNGGADSIFIGYNTVLHAVNTGIYVSEGYGAGGDTTDVIVRGNYVSMSACVNPTSYSVSLETTYSIVGVELSSNVAVCNDVIGSKGLLFGFSSPGGSLRNVSVLNNTFYGCGIGIAAYGPTVDASNVFKNNLIVAGWPWQLVDTNEANYSPDYDVMLNSWGDDIDWKGTQYDLAAFQAAKSKMTHSAAADPLLVSASDYHLQSTSPAINAGTDVSLTKDFSQMQLVGTPDIGAYEYQAATASPYTRAFLLEGGKRYQFTHEYRTAAGAILATSGTTCCFEVDP
jgi:hypothetical protein